MVGRRRKSDARGGRVRVTETDAPPVRESTAATLPLPLRYRLPNAPALFVGRVAESARFAEMVERSRGVLVVGRGGIGKTALALHALHAHFPARIARTLMLSPRRDTPTGDLAAEALRALAFLRGTTKLDWPGLLADREALAARVIDLAEAADVWLLVDDLQEAGAEAVEFFALAARYARKARWIATSREVPPDDSLADGTLVLGGMSADELGLLARRIDPALGIEAVEKSVIAAAGSPWELRHALVSKPESVRTASREQRGAVRADSGTPAPDARDDDDPTVFLRVLAALHLPVPPEDLARITRVPGGDSLDKLVKDGAIECTPAGIRLHDMARENLGPDAPVDPARAARITRGLALATSDVALLECVRLCLASARIEEALQLLGLHADRWFATGYAPRVWQLVERQADERFNVWRLRTALELGDGVRLALLHEPSDSSPVVRLWWARALALRGQVRAAATAAGEVFVELTSGAPDDLAFGAGFCAAKYFAASGDASRALAQLAVVTPPDDDLRVLRDSYLASQLARAGRHEEALRVALAILPDLDGLRRPPVPEAGIGIPPVIEAGLTLVQVFIELGRLRQAEAALQALEARLDEVDENLHVARVTAFSRALLAVSAGRLGEARDALARLGLRDHVPSSMREAATSVEISRRIAAGEFAGLQLLIARLSANTSAGGDVESLEWSRIYALELARLRAEPPPVEVSASEPTSMDATSTLRRLETALSCARRGALEEMIDSSALPDLPEIRITLEHLRAEFVTARGMPEAAAHAAMEGALRARRDGWRTLEARCEQALCDAMILRGDRDALLAAAGRLRALAQDMPSPRFLAEADFFEQIAAPASLDPVALERLALGIDVAPVAARRARALLGGTTLLDAIDQTVLARIHANQPAPMGIVTMGNTPGPWRAGWGLDERRRAIWTSAGRVIDLANRPQFWRILIALADADGRATREHLALRVWDVPAYHPLRDDNRIQVAMRRLREVLEDDPSTPQRLVTHEQGYAFGDAEIVRRLRVESACKPG